MKKSEIPFGAQFSPNQVDLSRLLQIIHDEAGNRGKIAEIIRDEFFATHAETQRLKLADNTILALRAYELLDEDGATPSALASDLLELAGTLEMYEAFAKHILINLRGISFVETVEIMQAAGEEINLHSLRKRLESRGLHVPRGAVHLSSLRLWLAQAGVFDVDAKRGARLYEVDQARLKQVLGMDVDAISSLSQLTAAQRAFLRALACIPETGTVVANKVADLATTLYGAEYNHKDLPKSILFPLRDLGYVELTKSTTGRGAKPYEVSRTPKFAQEISNPVLTSAAQQARLVPREFFEQPLTQILLDLGSTDKHVKGRALEFLTIYFTRLLDLDFKGWRTRSVDTGGAEVDVIVEGARFIFSRWQIQAKNTSSVRLGDVAKEVGLALTFIYSNVVMIVTTGNFTQDAHSYANHVMKTSSLNVILIGGAELKRIGQDPTEVATILNDKAERAMRIKERSDYFVAQ